MNLSTVSDHATAHTDIECAYQRAQNLAVLGAKRVLELCVGPSLKDLVPAYRSVGLSVIGNDIEPRWQEFYPNGDWLIGDALTIPWDVDTVVFAPPLSKGCTGKRDDALKISEVFPTYQSFLTRDFHGIRCLVLPARAQATPRDRAELHGLLGKLSGAEVVPLTAGRRKIRKYIDVYLPPQKGNL